MPFSAHSLAALALPLLLLPEPVAAGVTSPASAVRFAVAPAPAHDGVWPLQPRPTVVRGFDPPGSPWGRGHRGVDLLGRAGQPVHAALGGTISFVGVIAGRGVVVVDHGAVRTTYEPVRAALARGDTVGKGAVIGTLEHGGTHCPPRSCLHWGLLRGDTYLDPLTLVGGGPVRLLPPGT